MMADCSKNTHASCDPDGCFAAKCAYWRENGAPSIAYQGGRETFHNADSLAQRERQAVADARRGGIEPERYNASTRSETLNKPKKKLLTSLPTGTSRTSVTTS